MPLQKAEYGDFIYIAYAKEGYSDYYALKRELEKSACLLASTKDVMVDFTGCPDLDSPEMAALVRLVHTLQQLRRTVRVVAPPRVKELLTSVNLHKLPFLVISDTRDDAVKSLEKAG